MVANDSVATPEWLARFFKGWFDPCPLNPTFDGLVVPWQDPTFANIPYSTPGPWVDKAIQEASRGIRVVLLVRVDPSTHWWLKLVANGVRFAFFHGRIKFVGPNSPNFCSALVFL